MSQATIHAADLITDFLTDEAAPAPVAFVRIDEGGGYRYCIRTAAGGFRCAHAAGEYDDVYLLGLHDPSAAARLVDALEVIACESRRAMLELREVRKRITGRGADTRAVAPVCRWRARR